MATQGAGPSRATSTRSAASLPGDGDRHLLGRPADVEGAARRQGRGFVLYRAPRHDRGRPRDRGEYDDLLVIRTADAGDKQALVEADGPFFTIDHFRGYNAVLVQQSPPGGDQPCRARRGDHRRLGGRGPRRLAKEYFGR